MAMNRDDGQTIEELLQIHDIRRDLIQRLSGKYETLVHDELNLLVDDILEIVVKCANDIYEVGYDEGKQATEKEAREERTIQAVAHANSYHRLSHKTRILERLVEELRPNDNRESDDVEGQGELRAFLESDKWRVGPLKRTSDMAEWPDIEPRSMADLKALGRASYEIRVYTRQGSYRLAFTTQMTKQALLDVAYDYIDQIIQSPGFEPVMVYNASNNHLSFGEVIVAFTGRTERELSTS